MVFYRKVFEVENIIAAPEGGNVKPAWAARAGCGPLIDSAAVDYSSESIPVTAVGWTRLALVGDLRSCPRQ
jgi:hypothetical protein